jgi:hypothetical protein
MVSPYFPITNPTQSLGTGMMYASSEGGPYGVVNDKSTYKILINQFLHPKHWDSFIKDHVLFKLPF